MSAITAAFVDDATDSHRLLPAVADSANDGRTRRAPAESDLGPRHWQPRAAPRGDRHPRVDHPLPAEQPPRGGRRRERPLRPGPRRTRPRRHRRPRGAHQLRGELRGRRGEDQRHRGRHTDVLHDGRDGLHGGRPPPRLRGRRATHLRLRDHPGGRPHELHVRRRRTEGPDATAAELRPGDAAVRTGRRLSHAPVSPRAAPH